LISDFDRNSNEVVGQLNPNGVNAHNVWRMYERSEERGNDKFCYSEIRNFMKYFLGWETVVDLELVDLYCYQIFFSTIHCNL
jgi:hypothetical protein